MKIKYLIIALLIAFSTASFGSTIAFSNFTPNESIAPNVFEGAWDGFQSYAIVFESSESGQVNLVEAPFSTDDFRTTETTLSLYELGKTFTGIHPDSGVIPGAFIDSVTATVTDTPTILEFYGWNASLVAGEKYWLVQTATPYRAFWHKNGILNGGTGLGYTSNADQSVWVGPTGPVPALRVTLVTPVPAAVWLFCSGLLGLIGISRCKKVS